MKSKVMQPHESYLEALGAELAAPEELLGISLGKERETKSSGGGRAWEVVEVSGRVATAAQQYPGSKCHEDHTHICLDLPPVSVF